jgi:hypothetical protein
MANTQCTLQYQLSMQLKAIDVIDAPLGPYLMTKFGHSMSAQGTLTQMPFNYEPDRMAMN